MEWTSNGRRNAAWIERKDREMTNQDIARQRLSAFDSAMTAWTFGDWGTMTDVAARDAQTAAIEAAHGYTHGWIVVNGESFNHEKAFPERRYPRFPADQGLND
jgi:hypothetical protein